jgi:hypothetical protein
MKERNPTLASLPLGVLGLALPLFGACVHSDSHDHALKESEPNDAACCADYFGVLRPGDDLTIHGAISDDGFDPYDGFAFTAHEPITVEFRLYADSPFADLDVCLYDPQLGITVDCYESPFDPETGVAHILAGGVDFHLVVNAFVGDTAYTLRVEAFPLHFASGAAPPAAAGGAVQGGAHEGEEKPDRAAEFAAYHGAETASAPSFPSLVGLGELYLLDLATGGLRTAFLAATSDGTLVWMGNPDEEHASEGR